MFDFIVKTICHLNAPDADKYIVFRNNLIKYRTYLVKERNRRFPSANRIARLEYQCRVLNLMMEKYGTVTVDAI